MQRILDLAMEAGLTVPPIHTIDAIVSVIRKGNQKGFIHEIVSFEGYENDHFKFEKMD